MGFWTHGLANVKISVISNHPFETVDSWIRIGRFGVLGDEVFHIPHIPHIPHIFFYRARDLPGRLSIVFVEFVVVPRR